MSRTRARRDSRFVTVDLRQVRLALDGRPVLRGIDWRIEPGQRWVLMGANGAGKTQLMKVIAGDVWPSDPRGERRYEFQGETLHDPYGIKQEIAYLGSERQDRYEHYEWNHRVATVVGTGLYRTDIPLDRLTTEDHQRIAVLLRRLRIDSLAQRRFLTLSYGERRLVLLARALAWAPRLLLLDELFNGLDQINRQRVIHCLQRMSRGPLPWVLSTHRSEDIPDCATHVCELDGGKLIRRRRPPHRRRQLMSAGRNGASRLAAVNPVPAREHTEVLIALRNATVWREGTVVLRRLSLQIRRGDCWIVHGSNGSGKSSLIQLLYGDLAAASGGSITRAGVEPGVPLSYFKRRVGLVAPELQAVHPRYLSVEEVVSSGLDSSIGVDETVTSRRRQSIRHALKRVGALALARRAVRTLSYGQMRRVLFARALVHEPDMLLLDEPYASLDSQTRAALYALVQQAVETGVTVVLSTHHRDEWPQSAAFEIELSRSRARYCGALRSHRVHSRS